MSEFKKACKLSDLTEKRGKRVMIDEVDVAIFLFEGEIYALNNVCPHQHAAVMYDGYLDEKECTIACPVHGWDFDLKTGKIVGGVRGLDKYETKIIDGDVYVKVFYKELDW